MTTRHDPDPKFLESLEWELSSALRRQQTLQTASGVTPGHTGRMLLAAMLLMAFSLSLGAAGAWAIVQALEGPQRAHVIDCQALLLEVAQSRHAAVVRAAAGLEPAGADDTDYDVEAWQVALARIALAEEQVALQRLNHEESLRTGRAPDDSLSAPHIGRRDFTAERLDVRRERLARQLDETSIRAAAVREVEGVDAVQRLEAERDVQVLEVELDGLDRMRDLRRAFVEGRLDAARVERQGLLEQARTDRARVDVQLQSAQAINEHMRRLRTGLRLAPATVDNDHIDTTDLELRRQAAQRAVEHLERATLPDR